MMEDEVLAKPPEREGDDQQAAEGTDEVSVTEDDLEDAPDLDDEDDEDESDA